VRRRGSKSWCRQVDTSAPEERGKIDSDLWGWWVKQSAARRRKCEGDLELPVVGARGQVAIDGVVGPQVKKGRIERSD